MSEPSDLVKRLRSKAQSIRKWIKEHEAEDWASPPQVKNSLEEADWWDEAADRIEALEAKVNMSSPCSAPVNGEIAEAKLASEQANNRIACDAPKASSENGGELESSCKQENRIYENFHLFCSETSCRLFVNTPSPARIAG